MISREEIERVIDNLVSKLERLIDDLESKKEEMKTIRDEKKDTSTFLMVTAANEVLDYEIKQLRNLLNKEGQSK